MNKFNKNLGIILKQNQMSYDLKEYEFVKKYTTEVYFKICRNNKFNPKKDKLEDLSAGLQDLLKMAQGELNEIQKVKKTEKRIEESYQEGKEKGNKIKNFFHPESQ